MPDNEKIRMVGGRKKGAEKELLSHYERTEDHKEK